MTSNDESYVKTTPGSGDIAFVGPDAVALYRAVALRAGIRLYANTGMKPNRAWTPSAMLKAAGDICGKSYKRGQYHQAADDLTIWIDAMKAALPVVQ